MSTSLERARMAKLLDLHRQLLESLQSHVGDISNAELNSFSSVSLHALYGAPFEELDEIVHAAMSVVRLKGAPDALKYIQAQCARVERALRR